MNSNILIFFVSLAVIVTTLSLALVKGKEALIALIALQWVLANLFVSKQIVLMSLTVTASDALAVGATLGLNLLLEYYGRQSGKDAILITFLCLLFYTIVSLLQVAYIPAPVDTTHQCFVKLLTPMTRLAIASLTSYLVTQYLEYHLYYYLQRTLQGRHFIIRNYSSVSITQLVDTLLFTFLGLYGTIEHVSHVIIMSYAIKMITLIAMVPFLRYARRLI